MNNEIKHRKLGTDPLVGMYYVSECIKCGWIGSSGELTEDDAQCLQPVGDDHCWGDTDEIGADRLLELMQLGAFDKPATLLQSEPIAVVPEGYCLMPRSLTAENGAKALLIGEFKLKVTMDCPECCELEEPSEGCEICDGEGEYLQQHTIPWDQIKFIYSKAVAGLARSNQTK